jgi:adenylate cyclase
MARVRTSGAVLIDRVSDWLMESALGQASLSELVEGTAARLVAAGIPLARFHISFAVLHPLYRGMGLTWRPGQPLQTDTYVAMRTDDNPDYRYSPFRHMIEHRLASLRRRLAGPEALRDFPVLEELAREGGTDYLGFLVLFGGSDDGIAGSWVTKRPSGFSEREIYELTRIERLLAVACRMTIRGRVADNVVTTYLGRDAGRRVLSGQIRRGDGETLPAAVWYSDLRGSTRLAETLERERYTAVLNSYFECVGIPIIEAGGEILDFIGDAVLAIFPLAGDASQRSAIATRALAAAHEAFRRTAHANVGHKRDDMPALTFGLALHAGDVMFGNIGTAERLSFSVIGPTVNQVARLEALTKKLGRPLLASRAFAELLPIAWTDLGRHTVEGVKQPLDVLEPPTSVPAAGAGT